MGYARSPELEDEFTECFLTLASWREILLPSWRLGMRSLFGVFA